MKIAFLFSGQGAQKPGMIESLYNNCEGSQVMFEVLSEGCGRDLAELCFQSDQETLNQTQNTQPAMLAADLAVMAALLERGISPSFCAGFSLGEYAALVGVGALDAKGAASLVAKRSECMAKIHNGGMAAVIGVDASRLEELCLSVMDGYVEAVNYNCPGQTVVAGDQAGLDALQILLKEEKRARFMPLSVSGAFHSKLMKPAAQEFRPILDQATFHASKRPIVCNVTAEPFAGDVGDWPALLERQLCSPVRWEQSVRTLVEMGAQAFVECGPGAVLHKFNKRICPDIPSFAVENIDSLEAVVDALCEGNK